MPRKVGVKPSAPLGLPDRGVDVLQAEIPERVGKMGDVVRLGHAVGWLFAVTLERGKTFDQSRTGRKYLQPAPATIYGKKLLDGKPARFTGSASL